MAEEGLLPEGEPSFPATTWSLIERVQQAESARTETGLSGQAGGSLESTDCPVLEADLLLFAGTGAIVSRGPGSDTGVFHPVDRTRLAASRRAGARPLSLLSPDDPESLSRRPIPWANPETTSLRGATCS